jgi:hypothetical protein
MSTYDFMDDFRAPEIEQAVAGIEASIRKIHPEVIALFVKPQSERLYREFVRRRSGEQASS